MNSRDRIAEILIEKGLERFKRPYEKVRLAENYSKDSLLSVENDKAADCLLNDLEKNPQAFVLACLMDRRVDARRAWLIPYEISKELGDFSLATLLEPSLNRYKSIFNKKSLHRYNDDMAEIFYLAIEKIHKDFQDNASKIWAGSPKSGSVVRQFLSFKGGGVKIATMATNILAREFKISMKDLSCIDVSPDFQVMKVFTRTGLARQNARKEELMYVAREFYPDYPGVLDWPAWQIGSKFCRTKEEPECSKCYLNEYCPKVL